MKYVLEEYHPLLMKMATMANFSLGKKVIVTNYHMMFKWYLDYLMAMLSKIHSLVIFS